MPSSRPKSRLQQLREQIVKMGGDDVVPKFETLQLHAGMHTLVHTKKPNNCSANTGFVLQAPNPTP